MHTAPKQAPVKTMAVVMNKDIVEVPRKLKLDKQLFAVGGILAPLVVVAGLVVGSILDPTYSQIAKTVSELFERGAPNRDLLNAIWIVYNILYFPFAYALYSALGKGNLSKAITGALVAAGVLGIVQQLFFPLDVNGGTSSFTGMMHLVVNFSVVPLIFVMELGFWRAVKGDGRWSGYGRFSLAVFFVALIFGLATPLWVNSNVRGLMERIIQGSFFLWMGIVALKLVRLPQL